MAWPTPNLSITATGLTVVTIPPYVRAIYVETFGGGGGGYTSGGGGGGGGGWSGALLGIGGSIISTSVAGLTFHARAGTGGAANNSGVISSWANTADSINYVYATGGAHGTVSSGGAGGTGVNGDYANTGGAGSTAAMGGASADRGSATSPFAPPTGHTGAAGGGSAGGVGVNGGGSGGTFLVANPTQPGGGGIGGGAGWPGQINVYYVTLANSRPSGLYISQAVVRAANW
jgi:hypothetical protein